ncbi:MAG: DUF1501 domain-containing protein [Thiogranum sp.]
MHRRTFLNAILTSGMLVRAPLLLAKPALPARTLLLVELKGGNDGLNTVVPYADPAYYRLRPQLGLKRDTLLQLDEQLALHPALEPLYARWQRQQLAIALGVGYPDPNLSHFRSIEIWNTASHSDQYLPEGWVAQQFAGNPARSDRRGEFIATDGDPGPLAGASLNALVLRDSERFLRRAKQRCATSTATGNPALQHILATRQHIQQAAVKLEQQLAPLPGGEQQFPRGPFGRQLALAAQLVLSGLQVPVIKLSLGSFDTHTRQADQHRQLLQTLGSGLGQFAQLMENRKRWDDVLVMTDSEFGRRPKQNGSAGTDHGTAAPHFLLGGLVRGGLYGRQPSLTRLEDGNLRYTLDFRSLYSTLSHHWFRNAGERLRGYPPVSCLRKSPTI